MGWARQWARACWAWAQQHPAHLAPWGDRPKATDAVLGSLPPRKAPGHTQSMTEALWGWSLPSKCPPGLEGDWSPQEETRWLQEESTQKAGHLHLIPLLTGGLGSSSGGSGGGRGPGAGSSQAAQPTSTGQSILTLTDRVSSQG